MSVRLENKSKVRVPARDKTSKRNHLAKEFRKHHDRALAEFIWCQRHVNGERPFGGFISDSDILTLCGEHWQNMCNEWSTVARLCRQLAQTEARAGHWVVAALFHGVADELTAARTFHAGAYLKGIDSASELARWLPGDAVSIQGMKNDAFETIKRLPLLTDSVKRDVMQQTFSRPGRPADMRPVAAYAWELHSAGIPWSQVAARLVPVEQNVRTPAQAIRREVQRLKAVLKRHGISSLDNLSE